MDGLMDGNTLIEENVQNKINEISEKYCNPNDKTPFALRALMSMGEFAQYLSENQNNLGGNKNA